MAQPAPIRPQRDAIFTAALVFAVAALASIAVYVAAEGAMKQEIRGNLAGLAAAAAKMADPAAETQLTSPGQKDSDAFKTIITPFRALTAGDANISDIYTLTRDDAGKAHFIVDTQAAGSEAPAAIMDVYDGASKTLLKAFDDKAAVVEAAPYTDKWGTVLSAYAPIVDASHNFVGMAGVDMRVDQYNTRLNHIREALAIGLVIALLCAGGCGFGVYGMRRAMQKAQAQGQAQEAALAEMERRRIEAETIAAADARAARKAAMNELAHSFEASVQGVVRQVVEAAQMLQSESEQVTVIAEDTRDRSQSVSRISSDAAQTSSQVAAASEELTASIREIRAQTEKSSEMVRGVADKGQDAKAVIERLSQSSNKIGEVVTVINDIAGQINLLALNATIESARAGDAGKGFAVVANEVKSLSGQVSRALDEIANQVHDIQSETKLSVEAMNDILGSIHEISESTVVVASAITQQSDVTREIAHNIHATAQGARAIADNMVTVLESAGRTGTTADRVRATTSELQSQSQTLNREVEAFLQRVRA